MYLRTTQFIPQVTYNRNLAGDNSDLAGFFDKLLDVGTKVYEGQTAKSLAKSQAAVAKAQEALLAKQAELEERASRNNLLSNPLLIGGAIGIPLLLFALRGSRGKK